MPLLESSRHMVSVFFSVSFLPRSFCCFSIYVYVLQFVANQEPVAECAHPHPETTTEVSTDSEPEAECAHPQPESTAKVIFLNVRAQ
jgi:hypothetical protein